MLASSKSICVTDNLLAVKFTKGAGLSSFVWEGGHA